MEYVAKMEGLLMGMRAQARALESTLRHGALSSSLAQFGAAAAAVAGCELQWARQLVKRSHAHNLDVAVTCVGDLSQSLAGEMGTELVTAEHVRTLARTRTYANSPIHHRVFEATCALERRRHRYRPWEDPRKSRFKGAWARANVRVLARRRCL